MLALMLSALPASGQSPRWFAPEAVTPNVRVHAPYVLADLDGDGLHDLARLGLDDPADLLVERGRGDSTFAPAEVMPTTVTNPTHLRMADVDGDGLGDLVAVERISYVPSLAWVHVFRGDGDGGFDPAVVTTAPLVITHWDLGDLDGDGIVDLLVGGTVQQPGVLTRHEVHMLAGDGDGGFTTAWVRDGPDFVHAVGVLDLDADADQDLLLAFGEGTMPHSLLEVWHNDGTGETALVQTLPVPVFPHLVLDDVGGNGAVDVIAAGSDETAVLLNIGNGTFTDHHRFPASRDVDYVDVDGDGREDLIDLRQGLPDRLDIWRGRPQGRFELAASSPLWVHASRPRMADLDEDGHAELLAYTWGLGHGVFLGRADLTVESTRQPVHLPGLFTGDLSVADVDGDGVADLLSSAYTFGAPAPPGDVLIHHGVGGGTFEAPVKVRTPPVPQVIAAGDVNGDGLVDLVVSSQNNHQYTLLADGTGRYELHDDTVNALLFLLLEHLNADEHLDVVTYAPNGGGQLLVRRGVGDGTWQTAATLPMFPWRADAGDLDGDGDVDIVSNREVRLNEGHLDFSPAMLLDTGDHPIQPAIADFDEDGVPDLALGRADDDGRVAARILLGHGDGTFTPHLDLEAPDDPHGLCRAVDVDGDGHADVIVTLRWGAAIWAGRGDGSFDPPRIIAITSTPVVLALEDLNSDGRPDLALHRWPNEAFTMLNRLGPWRDLGYGLAAGSSVPHLSGQGSLASGTTVGLHVTGAAADARTTLVLGLDVDALPFAGGTVAPTLDLVLPGLSTDPGGRLSLWGAWPAGVPAGTRLFFQAWVEDDAGPQGFTASNALEATAP